MTKIERTQALVPYVGPPSDARNILAPAFNKRIADYIKVMNTPMTVWQFFRMIHATAHQRFQFKGTPPRYPGRRASARSQGYTSHRNMLQRQLNAELNA